MKLLKRIFCTCIALMASVYIMPAIDMYVYADDMSGYITDLWFWAALFGLSSAALYTVKKAGTK